MPMLDVTIPEGALPAEAERRLLARLTDLLIEHEGADPSNPVVRSITWTMLHRPTAIYVGGEPESDPHYRVVATVPEGQLTDERRAAIVHSVTEAVLDAEQGARPRDPSRVWVFPVDMPDGCWGAMGNVARLENILGFIYGDAQQARRDAERRLARSRQPVGA